MEKLGHPHVLLGGMTNYTLKEELVYLREQWRKVKGDEKPDCFQHIFHKVNASTKTTTSSHHWK